MTALLGYKLLPKSRVASLLISAQPEATPGGTESPALRMRYDKSQSNMGGQTCRKNLILDNKRNIPNICHLKLHHLVCLRSTQSQ